MAEDASEPKALEEARRRYTKGAKKLIRKGTTSTLQNKRIFEGCNDVADILATQASGPGITHSTAKVVDCLEAIVMKFSRERTGAAVTSDFLSRALPPVAEAAGTRLLEVRRERRKLLDKAEALREKIEGQEAVFSRLDAARRSCAPNYPELEVEAELQRAVAEEADLQDRFSALIAQRDQLQAVLHEAFHVERAAWEEKKNSLTIERVVRSEALEAVRVRLPVELAELEKLEKEAAAVEVQAVLDEREVDLIPATEERLKLANDELADLVAQVRTAKMQMGATGNARGSTKLGKAVRTSMKKQAAVDSLGKARASSAAPGQMAGDSFQPQLDNLQEEAPLAEPKR
eukprot:gnl/TRDRNA2_/TRDRNA2_186988_c0_seq1.p1 gnl/TRDRNA2_/TRDRNA2_186988_c0~~gnl/TRDRNA2_/TRDRNA2_186988_c0_seq1.p1  ORF type:complete len:380 (-),score=109.40 gnl/TRDRNA2_/TRDRNA2_186988_c0_seq1:85-1122(-)